MLTAPPCARTTRPCARIAPAPTWTSPRITAERAISGCGWSTSIWFKLTATHRPHGRPGVRPVVPDTTRALAARLPGPALREQRPQGAHRDEELTRAGVGLVLTQAVGHGFLSAPVWRTAAAAFRAATRIGSQTGANGGA